MPFAFLGNSFCLRAVVYSMRMSSLVTLVVCSFFFFSFLLGSSRRITNHDLTNLQNEMYTAKVQRMFTVLYKLIAVITNDP